MEKAPYLSVVIPCYNEETNLEARVLTKVNDFLKKKKYDWEVLVVDDGSTDKSKELIKRFIKNNHKFSLIENPHQGKAAAVITGMLKATGKYLLFSDLDQATPIEELDKLLPWFDKGYDVVIGSRNSERRGAPLSRLAMARGFMLLRNLLLGLPGISDTQCGFKAFRKETAHKLFKKLKLYKETGKVEGSHVTAGFDIELLFIAKKMGFKIREVPVVWRYVETRRVSPVRDSWEGLMDLVRIKINDLRGVYE